MKNLLTLLIVIYIVFSTLTANAQLNVYSGSIIEELQFCSSSTEIVSVILNESKPDDWDYYFPGTTGNIITLTLSGGFTFGNDSETDTVKVYNSTDINITNIEYGTNEIKITFDHTGNNVDNIAIENIILVTPVDYNVNSANFKVNSCLYNASNVAQNKTVTLTSTASLARNCIPCVFSKLLTKA